MSEKELQVLALINKNSSLTQRDLSEELGISVGKVNATINRLISEGYIYIEKVARKSHYFLSNTAIETLEEYLQKTLDKKIVLSKENHVKVKQAVILAAGERKEFDRPIGFLKIGDTTIAKRIIDILTNHGIEKIVIVTGYKSKFYEDFGASKNLILVKNEKYKWTGTMYSLALAEKYIDEDFLLIENDMIFEERAITEVLGSANRNCVLLTNESGSGDEALVEIRNGYMFKMSKDIHQLNKIDGEMIGISKISKDIFKKMMGEFRFNRNPYFNYEYALMDVARSFDIGYVKIDDLVWSEVDNLEHYDNLVNYVFPRLKRKEAEIRLQVIKDTITTSLNIDEASIKSVEPFGGMTNKNYRVVIGGKSYVLRIPGTGTEAMINRLYEKKNSNVVNDLGIDTKNLYFNEFNGVKIAEFIEQAETLNAMTAKREDNMKLTSSVLRILHTSKELFDNTFDAFQKINEYEKILDEANGKNFEDYHNVKTQVIKLRSLLNELGMELRPCHNDTVPENFIKSGEDKIYLIDWEYSGMNDPMWDIAAHSLECNFSEDDEELFLQTYFNGEVSASCRKRILIHKICQDFLWSIWTNIKEAKGDDFGTYGIDRYNRAKKNLKLLEED